jgi:hypothetical protein
MHAFFKVMVLSGSIAVAAAPALAQTPAKSRIQGLGGFTFGTETGGSYEGGFAREIRPALEIIAEGGYMHSVLPKSIGNYLERRTEALTGVDFDYKAPAFFGAGGVRYLFPTTAHVRPYGEGVVGLARIDVKNNYSDNQRNDALVDDTAFERSYNGATNMLVGFGGGIIVPRGQWYVSAGYSYRRLFSTNPAANISRFAAGIGRQF